ncbi:MAG: hypothetical protein JXA74_17540 [Anaerolineae bacterium]|nr:hypothetical protein [Anaerolineae bacterium]
MPSEILSREEVRRGRAWAVLERLDLVRRWSRYGRVVLHGALSYRLMVALDIDMGVVTPNPRPEHGFAVVSEVARIGGVWQVRYRNQLENPADPGLYWGIHYRDESDQVWKIDTWFLPMNHPHVGLMERQVEAFDKALTDEMREIILMIKEAVCGDQALRGMDIYQAVLQGGQRDVEGCRQWVAEHRVEGINRWLPA